MGALSTETAEIVSIAGETTEPSGDVVAVYRQEETVVEPKDVAERVEDDTTELLTHDLVLADDEQDEIDIDGLIDDISLDDEQDEASYDEIFSRLGR